MKSVNFGDKNLCFCEKPKYLVNKSTPSISRILYPETGHPICDHLDLIFSGNQHKKSSKLMILSYFVITNFFNTIVCSLPLKILTFSKKHIKRYTNFSLKHRKITKCFNIFDSSRKLIIGLFLIKTCSTSSQSRRTVRQNHEIPFRSTFAHFLSTN